MTEDIDREFVLGEEVTHLVRGKRPGSIVLSLRLSSDEIAALSNIAEDEDKTVTQIAREGIRARIERKGNWATPVVSATLGVKGSWTVSFGPRPQTTGKETQVSGSSEYGGILTA